MTKHLASAHSILAAVEPRHAEQLFGLFLEAETEVRWRFRGSTPSPEALQEMLWRGVFAQFMVSHQTTPDRIDGLVSAYDVDFTNGIAHLSVVLHPRVHGKVWPMEAIGVFFDYVFKHTQVRKLYVESPLYAARRFLHGATRRLFQEEGRLREYEFFDGEYWDVVILALRRETWSEERGRYALLLERAETRGDLPKH